MISGIGHAAFGVSALERSLAFYCGGLGLREAFRLYNDRGETWIVYIQVQGLDFIELFPDARVRGGAPAEHAYRHLCLMVDDMDATLADLATRAVATDGPKRQGKDGNWQAWLTDPDGNRIELMQIMPDSPQQRAADGRGA
ncbi:MAG TPA: VOC family protein [Bacillota bacterium]|nr:VOC family protein [Bacillota bacterium]